MPTMGDPILFIILGALFLSMLVVLIYRFLRRPDCSVDVFQGSRWKLGTIAHPGRKYKLCHRFHVQFNGPEEGFGLVADYRLSAGGEVLVNERAGVGTVQPPARDRFISVQTMVSYGTNSLKDAEYGHAMHRATIVLAAIGPFSRATELTAEGEILLNSGARLASGEIFFA